MTFSKFNTPLTKIAAIVLLATTSLTACNQQTTKTATVQNSVSPKDKQQTSVQLVANYHFC